MNYYEILGVAHNATLEEIKKAYYNKCMEWHPDIHGNSPIFHEMMCKINEAYEVLANPSKRADYDKWLEDQVTKENTKPQASQKQASANSVNYDFVWRSYYDEDLDSEAQQQFINWLKKFIFVYRETYYNDEYYKINMEKFENIYDYEIQKIKKNHLSK